jgi:hypothetical protein
LGVIFDSNTLTWKLPDKKRFTTLNTLKTFLDNQHCTLHQFQKLHGKLNDFAQLCVFLKGYRYHQTLFLQRWASTSIIRMPIPLSLRVELQVWGKCLLANADGFPIPAQALHPPLSPRTFVSDAAGAALQHQPDIVVLLRLQ